MPYSLFGLRNKYGSTRSYISLTFVELIQMEYSDTILYHLKVYLLVSNLSSMIHGLKEIHSYIIIMISSKYVPKFTMTSGR